MNSLLAFELMINIYFSDKRGIIDNASGYTWMAYEYLISKSSGVVFKFHFLIQYDRLYHSTLLLPILSYSFIIYCLALSMLIPFSLE